MEKVAIVGGGIAGIVAALILADRVEKVYLIERESKFGGLLGSYLSDDGVYFDKGTHIISETGIAELDQLLYSKVDPDTWQTIDVLKPGNYFSGELYPWNQSIHAPSLPKEIYNQGVVDFLNTLAFPMRTDFENLQDYSDYHYGETFTSSILGPVMKKLLDCDLRELTKTAHHIFGYNRLILGIKEVNIELKKNSRLESRLSFSTYLEGISPLKKFYPKHQKGIGLWVEGLIQEAQSKGVELITNAQIDQVSVIDHEIRSFQLKNGQTIELDHLVWTIPPIFLLQHLGYQSQYRPKMRKLMLFHLIFDQTFLVDNHYVYCNEPGFQTFRVTLYPNFASDCAHNKCTVEAFWDEAQPESECLAIMIDELQRMGIISEQAKLVSSHSERIYSGFPALTVDFVKENQRQHAFVDEQIKNITLLGKGNGNQFFMNEVLVHLYKELSAQFTKIYS